MLDNEGHLPGPDFQYRAGATAMADIMAETGIEETRIVHTELTDERIERHHFGGEIRRDRDRFARGEDIEFVGIEHDRAGTTGVNWLPIVQRLKRIAAIDIDDPRVAPRPPSHLALPVAFEIHRECEPVVDICCP